MRVLFDTKLKLPSETASRTSPTILRLCRRNEHRFGGTISSPARKTHLAFWVDDLQALITWLCRLSTSMKAAVFDVQINPANPAFSYEKLQRAKDRGFRSTRISSDLRMIVHQASEDVCAYYVGQVVRVNQTCMPQRRH